MSYAQGILKAVADKSLAAETCNKLIRALGAIPEVFHADFVAAYFKDDESEPEEQPEDYLAVKTFASSEFHIGDEVTDGAYVGFVTRLEGDISVVMKDGSVGDWDINDWHRTGRNFPAIPAILEELKKS